MKLLITGGTGFIGQSLVPALLATNHAVTLLVQESYASGKPLPLSLRAYRSQFDLVYADLRQFNLTVRAIATAAPDVVIHLATVGTTDPFLPIETAIRHNLMGTIHLIRACFEKNQQVQQLIVARTPGEWGQMNVYATSKAAAWQFCLMYAGTYHWPIHGAMIFQVYGPGQPANTLIPAAMAAASAGQDFPMTSGKSVRDWIYVQDVAKGLVSAVGARLNAGTTFDLGTGITTTVAQVVQQIYALISCGGSPLLGILPDRPNEAPIQKADTLRTRNLLNWQATTPLSKGLSHLLSAD